MCYTCFVVVRLLFICHSGDSEQQQQQQGPQAKAFVSELAERRGSEEPDRKEKQK